MLLQYIIALKILRSIHIRLKKLNCNLSILLYIFDHIDLSYCVKIVSVIFPVYIYAAYGLLIQPRKEV